MVCPRLPLCCYVVGSVFRGPKILSHIFVAQRPPSIYARPTHLHTCENTFRGHCRCRLQKHKSYPSPMALDDISPGTKFTTRKVLPI